jgi:SPP1 family predicted phage head-tail adaptor
MKISDLRHRITLQRKDIVKDPEGIAIETWADVATVWASVEPIRGREYFQAAAVNAENTVRFRIRYRPGIMPNMRVLYNGRTFNIQSVIDVNERHREIQLMCQEVTNGGGA